MAAGLQRLHDCVEGVQGAGVVRLAHDNNPYAARASFRQQKVCVLQVVEIYVLGAGDFLLWRRDRTTSAAAGVSGSSAICNIQAHSGHRSLPRV